MKDAYAHANRALGDIVKVTPSSKVPALPILPIPGAVWHNFAYPRDKQGERRPVDSLCTRAALQDEACRSSMGLCEGGLRRC